MARGRKRKSDSFVVRYDEPVYDLAPANPALIASTSRTRYVFADDRRGSRRRGGRSVRTRTEDDSTILVPDVHSGAKAKPEVLDWFAKNPFDQLTSGGTTDFDNQYLDLFHDATSINGGDGEDSNFQLSRDSSDDEVEPAHFVDDASDESSDSGNEADNNMRFAEREIGRDDTEAVTSLGLNDTNEISDNVGSSVSPTMQWFNVISNLLDELHRHDGREEAVTVCSQCSFELDGDSPVVRCVDCIGLGYVCARCAIVTHEFNPFHRTEVWSGSFWKRMPLVDLGMVIQISHSQSSQCPSPGSSKRLTVIDTTGIHSVQVQFCACSKSSGALEYKQLLRTRWLPATVSRPATVVTFSCLNLFHLLTVQGKLTAYDFYLSLLRTTDNTGIDPPPKRYEELMRCTRLWRLAKMLKRAGVAYAPEGVASAEEGSCAVMCPACPQPGKNMRRDNVDLDPIEPRYWWLEMLFVMLDANFRLKCKERSLTDPSLVNGLAYFVRDSEYKRYIEQCGLQTEISICDSTLHAVDHANLRGGSKYSASGVGACQCRHMMVRPNGVGDLQKGERYANIDYIFWSSLKNSDVPQLLVSYDIGCQWQRNLMARRATLPEQLRSATELVANAKRRILIPKFHIYAHGMKCQASLSLHTTRGVARTDGENIERGWAWMNPASLSMREMGPGMRQDTLDDQWSFWNWCILIKLGETLYLRLEIAIINAAKQRKQHEEFTSTFPAHIIAEWTDIVDRWNESPLEAENPYFEDDDKPSYIDVRRALNEEESAEIDADDVPVQSMTAGQFLAAGLEYEEQQRNLHALYTLEGRGMAQATPITGSNQRRAKKTRKATSRTLSLEDKDVTLRRKILGWQETRKSYMPGLHGVLNRTARVDPSDDNESHTVLSAIDMDLRMPSSFTTEERRIICSSELAEKESRLRLAQLQDALVALRKHLRISWKYRSHKDRHTAGTGTKPNTRMNALIKRWEAKGERDAARYRAARKALGSLDPNGEWCEYYLELLPSHMRMPRRTQGEGEGGLELSWIWKVNVQDSSPDSASTNVDIQQGLRTEWAMSLARVERWEEEVILVKEEMRRTLAFLDARRRWWMSQIDRREDARPDVKAGLAAYANKQAQLCHSLAYDFASDWLALYREGKQDLPKDWPQQYLNAVPLPKHVKRRPGRTKLHITLAKLSAEQSSAL